MNVPAPPLNGLTGTALQVPGVPGTGGGFVPPPGGGLELGLTEGLGDTLGLGLALRDGEAAADDGEVTLPVQVTPLRVKLVGTGFDEPFHAPLKPKDTDAFVPTDPL
jgi:hypothetical protein